MCFSGTAFASFSEELSKSQLKKFERLVKKADRNYDAYSYQKSIGIYEKALELNPDPNVKLKLADSYRHINEPAKSERWYRATIEDMQLSEDDMLNFGQVLSANGKYEEALAIFEKYEHKEDWVDDHVHALKNVDRFYVNEIAFDLQESIFNSEEKDFSPSFENDQLVFVTGRPSSGLFKPQYQWDNSRFLDLFTLDSGFRQSKVHRGINTRFHEGPATFFDSGDKMFFTRNNYLSRKAGQSEEGVNMLKIYYSERKNERRWKKPTEFPHNDDHHSTGHPTISSDGKTLYFASDMPGGYGGVDLYKSEFVNGAWQKPENLGAEFNTSEDEMFPFLHEDEVLYFASNGLEGLGGLDIFRKELDSKYVPRNLGFPLNTNADDFGIALKNGTNKGYFSSNRVGGTGDDDIYDVTIYDYIIEVNLIDSISGKPINGGLLVHEEFGGQTEYVASIEDNNTITFRGLKGSSFIVDGLASEYEEGKLKIATSQRSNEITHLAFDLPLVPLKKGEAEILIVENNKNISQVFVISSNDVTETEASLEEIRMRLANERIEVTGETILKNVYYDYDVFTIREDAGAELNKLFEYLVENENLNLLLESHTDVRGSLSYNERLARNRAEAARDYLVEKGLSYERISFLHYGEERVFNECEEEACEEDEHQENRRTEIRLKLKEK